MSESTWDYEGDDGWEYEDEACERCHGWGTIDEPIDDVTRHEIICPACGGTGWPRPGAERDTP